MIVDIIVGFLIAVLSGMGIGSAGLLVVWLTAYGGTEQLAAQGLNLYFFLFSSAASLLIHIRRRRILWGMLFVMIIFGALGAVLGSVLAGATEPGLLRKIFGGMLIISGVIALIKSIKSAASARSARKKAK